MKKMTIQKFWQWFLDNKEAIDSAILSDNCAAWNVEILDCLSNCLGVEEIEGVYLSYHQRSDKFTAEIRFDGTEKGLHKLNLLLAKSPSLNDWSFQLYQLPKIPVKLKMGSPISIDPYDCWFSPDEVSIENGVTSVKIYASRFKDYINCFHWEMSRILRLVVGKGNYEDGKLRYKMESVFGLSNSQKSKLVKLVHWNAYVKIKRQ